MKAYKYKRRLLNLSIEREFQKWLMIRIFGVIILCSVLAAAVLFFYARHETVTSFYSAHIKIRRVSDLLLPVVLSGSFVSLLAGTFLAFFLPQKIAGPLYRVEKELQAVGDGDLTVVIRLRKQDTLKSFAAVINEVVADLKHEVQQLQAESQVLQNALEKEDCPAVAAAAKRLHHGLLQVRT
ncbi:MAG: methyl-accepting chemotaxis protein [Deltaproteobacteria bacterium]|nr:methyl-accepting chemotaxis protein [Deltaproteobacteria bacterium]